MQRRAGVAIDTNMIPWGTNMIPWGTNMIPWGTNMIPWGTYVLELFYVFATSACAVRDGQAHGKPCLRAFSQHTEQLSATFGTRRLCIQYSCKHSASTARAAPNRVTLSRSRALTSAWPSIVLPGPNATHTITNAHIISYLQSNQWQFQCSTFCIYRIFFECGRQFIKYVCHHFSNRWVPTFWTHGSVCCACAQRPGLPRASPFRARCCHRNHNVFSMFIGTKLR